MNKIEAVFKGKTKPVFIGYLMAGHPTLEQTPLLVKAMEEGGADIVEIGIPYSDPLADGPIIQAAGQKALLGGATVDRIFDRMPAVKEVSDIPLIFMVYFSTIYQYGIKRFINRCIVAGIDGLIIPDMPLEERDEILPLLGSDLAFIPLVAPTSKERITGIILGASGFVYCVSSLGVTGENGHFHPDLLEYLRDVRQLSELPIAVGFGISKREDIINLAPYTDGVIVGTALVKAISESDGNPDVLRKKVSELTDKHSQ